MDIGCIVKDLKNFIPNIIIIIKRLNWKHYKYLYYTNDEENCSHAFTTRKRDVIYVFMSICASKVVYTKWLCHARLVSERKDNKLIGNGTMYNKKNEGLLSYYDKHISQKFLILKLFCYLHCLDNRFILTNDWLKMPFILWYNIEFI